MNFAVIDFESSWKEEPVEQVFQGCVDELRAAGYDVDSLAIVESMDPETGTIEFRS